MNYKLVMRLLVIIPLLMQGAPDDSSSMNSSNSRMQGVWPWVLGAATLGIGTWAYKKRSTAQQTKEPLSKLTREEHACQAEITFKDCLKDHQNDRRNRNGMPSACSDVALSFALAYEPLNRPGPRIQKILDSFQQYNQS